MKTTRRVVQLLVVLGSLGLAMMLGPIRHEWPEATFWAVLAVFAAIGAHIPEER